MRAQTEKTTFSCKDEAHTALDIFRFAVFLLQLNTEFPDVLTDGLQQWYG